MNLATAAGFENKRVAMATGEHINSTEDRAVMHIALRAAKDRQLFVDGVNVVPAVYQVLDRVRTFYYSFLYQTHTQSLDSRLFSKISWR